MTSTAAIPLREAGRFIDLALRIEDPEVVSELQKRADPADRSAFALTALRIGVLALRSAGGQLDAGAIREAGTKLLGDLETVLSRRAAEMSGNLGNALKEYLDPRTGLLQQRLDALVREGGELQRILADNVGPDRSVLAESLARSIGEQSPIFRMLSPTDANGLRAQLTATLQKALDDQRAAVVRQFSLDDKDSALSRLVEQVRAMQSGLQTDLREQVDHVTKEFTLDRPDSALSRLTSLLGQASEQINKNLTLDDEGSALSRLRRELMGNLADMARKNSEFQTQLASALAAMQARREADQRGTVHGLEFEDQLGAWLGAEAQRLGDVHEATGATAGQNGRCKTGDHVIQLGPESAAPGVRLVWEAKQVGGYTLKKAIDEIDEARRNRCATIGVFVFSRRTAPEGLAQFQRIGQDFFVVWDAEDGASDLVLRVTYSAARALAVRDAAGEEAHEVASALDKAVRAAEKKLEKLDQIKAWANTIEANSKKIGSSAEDVKDELEAQIAVIDAQVESLKCAGE